MRALSRNLPQESDWVGNGWSASVTALPGRSAQDAALMGKIASARDRSALDALARHYGPRLKSWLMARGEQAHTAEDIVHDVLINIWIKADLFDPAKASFSTWAYRLTRNRWIDCKRRNDRMQPTAPEMIANMWDAPVEAADIQYNEAEAAAAVQRELALLSADQKEILHLAFFEGLSHSQIAERTGMALGTVKSRIRAPLKKLQTRLKDFRGVDHE